MDTETKKLLQLIKEIHENVSAGRMNNKIKYNKIKLTLIKINKLWNNTTSQQKTPQKVT